jgi:hypothetical protein
MNSLEEWIRHATSTVRCENELKTVNRLFQARGWSDGLPIIPPTPERVRDMLAYCDRPWDVPVGKVAPRYGEATPIRMAVNAVMAGCEPEYFPVLLAAVEAMCDPAFNLYALQATTHPCAPLLMVNGPIALELEINAGVNAFGQGRPANATIGRAIRLMLMNIGGGYPGTGDMATLGAPSKFSFCVAENEAESPWPALSVERGFDEGISTVTLVGAEPPHNVNDHASSSGLGILKMIAGTMRTTGNNDIYNYQEGTYPQPLVVFGPEHAKTVSDDGYGKEEIREYLFEHARVPLGDFSRENIENRFSRKYGDDAPADLLIPVFKRPQDLLIAVVGGPGKHSAVFPTFGATQPITRPISHGDGRPARSIADLKARR